MVAHRLARYLLSLGSEASLAVVRRGCKRAGRQGQRRRCRRRRCTPPRTMCLEHHRPLLAGTAVVSSAGLLLARFRRLKRLARRSMRRLGSSSEGRPPRRRPFARLSGHLPHRRRQTRAGVVTTPRPGVRSTVRQQPLQRVHLRCRPLLLHDKTATFNPVDLLRPTLADRGLGPTT